MTNPRTTSANDAALRLDNQLCFALYSTSLAMTKLYKPLLEELQLTLRRRIPRERLRMGARFLSRRQLGV